MELQPSILLVADDDALRDALSEQLRRSGCEVLCVRNAVEAFAEAMRRSYDTVFVDAQMPGLSGADAIPYLNRYVQDTPIVVLSDANDVEEQRAIQRGAACVLRKPVDARIAVDLVRLAVRQRRTRTHRRRKLRPLNLIAAWEGTPA